MISSSKYSVDVASKDVVVSMQTGQYTVTASWADVGNGFEITIPTTGQYSISCQFTAYVDYTGNSECGVIYQLAKNGTQIPGTYGRMHKYRTSTVGNEHGQGCHVVAPIQTYNAGDVIRLRAYKNNTDPAYILYGNTFLGWSDGYIQAEMVTAYVPVATSEERLFSATDVGANQALTTSMADVSGWTITIPRTGRYIIRAQGSYQLDDNNADGDIDGQLQLAVNSTAIPLTAVKIEAYGTANNRKSGTFSIVWEDDFVAGDVVTLQGQKETAAADLINVLGASRLGRLSYESVSTTIPINTLQTVGDWTNFTMTIGGTTTPPTKGTVVVDNAKWRRVGQNMEIMYTFEQSTAGTAGSGTYLFPIPGGETIDTTLLPVGTSEHNAVCGSCGIRAAGSNYVGYIKAYNSTNLALIVLNSTSNPQFVDSGWAGLNNNPAMYSFTASVPISGW